MHYLAIILLTIFAAVVYGIAHDLVTVRICLEYFTIGHPPIFPTHSPTMLAFAWGIVATWWAGLLIGVPLAICARAGRRPKLSAPHLLRRLVVLLLLMASCAALGALIGRFSATRGIVFLLEPIRSRVPADRHVDFITCLWAHSASYLVGFVGGIVLCIQVYRSRRRMAGAAGSEAPLPVISSAK